MHATLVTCNLKGQDFSQVHTLSMFGGHGHAAYSFGCEDAFDFTVPSELGNPVVLDSSR